jgi:hypothetical protein
MLTNENRHPGKSRPSSGGDDCGSSKSANVVPSSAELNWLERELLDAHRLAFGSLLDRGFQVHADMPLWGIQHVECDGAYYTPSLAGRSALITPAVECGALLDLVATDTCTRQSWTRRGEASVLGFDTIDVARLYETALQLFADPVEWLLNRCQGAVVLNWERAASDLADLPTGIICSTNALARRLDCAFRRPLHIPPIFVPEV